MTTIMRAGGERLTIHSLRDLASHEADAFKWLESERCGYDVGSIAHREWCRRYWRTFCRYRRIDHLLGTRRIREFDDDSFGSLNDPIFLLRPVVSFVVQRFVHEGWENLHFFLWAESHGFSEREILDVLSVVDVNSARIDPPWT